MLIPQGTRDFTSALLTVQQTGPDVVAAAVGGDDQKAMRTQVAELGLGAESAWINNQQDWPDVYGLPMDNLFGVFGTTWYYDLDLPGVDEFVAKYQEMYPDTAMRVPGQRVLQRLLGDARAAARRSKRRAPPTIIAVIKQLEGLRMPAETRMQHHDAFIEPRHPSAAADRLPRPGKSRGGG